ncbi:MAG: CHAT domain-containing tetratricopeptide repeat protein [Bacteroidota bacterium]
MPLLLLTDLLKPGSCLHRTGIWIKQFVVVLLFTVCTGIPSAVWSQDDAGWLEAGLGNGNELLSAGNYSAAIDTFSNLVSKATESAIPETETLAMILHRKGVALYLIDKNQAAVDAYRQSLAIRRKLLGDNHLDVARSYHNIGTCFEYMGKHDEAIENLKKGLDIRQQHDVKKDLAYSYLRVGKNYFETGDYDRALEYYAPSLTTYIDFYGNVHPRVAEVYNHSGMAYFRKLDYTLAAENFSKALDILSDPSINNLERQTICLNNLGAVFYQEKKYNKALEYYKQSIAITKKLKIENEVFALNHMNIGLAYKGLEQYDQSADYLNTALEIGERLFGENDPRLAIYYDNLAELSAVQKNYQTTLNYYQDAIQLLIPGYVPQNQFGNPDLDNDDVIGSKSLLLTILSNKARTIKIWWDEVPDDDSKLEQALASFVTTDKLIDRMRREHTAKGSKLFWTGRTLPIYENAISTALALFEKSKDNQYLEQAFYFTEKSKAILLLESLKESDARQFAGLPDSLLSMEAELKAELTKAEQALFNETQKISPDSAKLKSLQNTAFEIKEKTSNLIALLEENHPEYFHMKYDMTVAKISDIQALLEEGQAMVEYFVGDQNVFIIKIESSGVKHYQLGKSPELENDIRELRDNLLNYFFMPNSDDEMFKTSAKKYADLAHQLYHHLLGQLIEDQLPETLFIIPDGALGYLPFGALLTEVPEVPDRFKSHAYLINDYQISYSYSATLWREMLLKSQNEAKRSLLAFAPSFGEQSSEGSRGMRNEVKLGRLLHNDKEVETIHDLLGGKALYGQDATEAAFRQMASRFRIIHFATHGKANDENSDYSFLAFTEIADSLENEFLYVHDLYSMRLNADLVVLSACETGIGKLYRGEGISSLARGFSYAGVPAMVTTLWSVNDAQTSVIISDFYRNLKSGMTKDAALRTSKLDYIRSNDNYLAHPFFWAAAIPIGNMEPVNISTPTPIGLYSGIIFGIIALFLIFRKIRQRKAY